MHPSATAHLLLEHSTDIHEGVQSFSCQLEHKCFGINSLIYFFLSSVRIVLFIFEENCEDKFTEGFRWSENVLEEVV